MAHNSAALSFVIIMHLYLSNRDLVCLRKILSLQKSAMKVASNLRQTHFTLNNLFSPTIESGMAAAFTTCVSSDLALFR